MKFLFALISVLLSSMVAFALAAMDLNTASEKDLEALPGVGKKVAEQIIAARPFKSVDDLQNVKGIGPGKLAKIRPLVTVSGSTAASAAGAPVAPATADTTTATAPAAAASTANSNATAPAAASTAAAPANARGAHAAHNAKLAAGQTVNINTASIDELEKIPGIGPAKAQSIIQNRPFNSVDELTKVKGIKGATLAKIRPYVVAQ